MFTAFSISSIDMKMTMMLRRVITPIDADDEQRRRQHHVVGRVIIGIASTAPASASTIAPTIATSSSIDATSNGIR